MSTGADVQALAEYLAQHDETAHREPRTERVNLRARPSDLNIIRYAAAVKGESLSEFLLTAAIHRAQHVIEDRARVVMNKKDFEAFAEDLDSEPQVVPVLARVAARFNSV